MAKKKKAEDTAPRCPHERFEVVEIHRRQIKNAPYNPRKIVPSARKNLKRVLEKLGLVQPLNWNVCTGNLVGGHQRLSVLDGLMGTKDYTLRVAQIDVDDKREREVNLALNNPSIQGDWDMDLLEKCLRGDEVKIDIEDAGFNLGDVYNTFGYSPLESNSEQLTALAEQLRGLRERHRAHQAKSDARNDFDYYRVPVFASNDEALEFDELLQVPHMRFTDGRILMSVLKFAREHGWQASGAAGIQDE